MALRLKQNSTSYPLVFFMRDASGIAVTGLSPTVLIFKNGPNGISPAGAVSQGDNGAYQVAGNATDTNTLGPLILTAVDSTQAALPDERDFEVTVNGCEEPAQLYDSVVDVSPAAGSFKGSSALSATDNFYNKMVVCFTSGTLKGLTAKISAYTGSTRLLAFATAFPAAPANGDLFVIIGHLE